MKTNDWNKKKYIRNVLVYFAVLLAVLLPKGVTARVYGSEISAPTGTVSNLRQTGATTASADIQFDAFLGTDVQYAILVGTSASSVSTEYTTVSKGTATLSGLAAGSTYYVQVIPFRGEVTGADGTGEDDFDESIVDDSRSSAASVKANVSDTSTRIYGTASAVISVVTAPSQAPASVTQTASGTDSVTISWSAVSGASGYIVDYFLTNSDSGTPEKASLKATDTSAVLTGLSASKTYTANVMPYRTSAEGYIAYDSSVCASKTNLAIGAAATETPKGTVTGFVQEKAAADSATVSFKIPDAAAQYSVQLGTGKDSGYTEYSVVTEGSVSLTELSAASSYYIRVVPFYQKWNALNEEYERVYGTVSEVFEIVTAPNAGPKKITQIAADVTGLSVEWDAVSGANGYYVDYYRAGSTQKTTINIAKNQLTLTELAKNSEYNIFVTPYRKSASGFTAVDETIYTASYNIPVRPSKAGKASVTKFWQSIGKVNLKTKKIACADGYEYALYPASSGKKIASGSSTGYSSADIKSTKLKKSAVYKVRVRAYVTVKGEKVYGAWSDWTYISASGQVTLKRSKTGIHASWSKVTGADRYLVYISTDKDSGYRKCFVTAKTSCDIKSYGKKKIETGKKYYVYVIPQVNVSGRYVSAAKKDAVAEIK